MRNNVFRFVSICICICLIVTNTMFYLGKDSGNNKVYASTTSLAGGGTVDSPYLIYNETDLIEFRHLVNDYGNVNIHAKLMNNITLVYNWEPIGTAGYAFSGSFDGCGYSIRNIKIDKVIPYSQYRSDSSFGFFGYVYDGVTISNLSVYGDIIIESNNSCWISSVGGIAGRLIGNGEDDGSAVITCFTNCINNINIVVSEDDYDLDGWGIGGILGAVYDIEGWRKEIHFTDCYNNANLKIIKYHGTEGNPCTCNIGGIIGTHRGNRIDTKLYECYNIGDLTGYEHCDVGGLIGYNFNSTEFRNCYVDCNFNVDFSQGQYVGGLVGLNHLTDIEVHDCFVYLEQDINKIIGFNSIHFEYSGLDILENFYYLSGYGDILSETESEKESSSDTYSLTEDDFKDMSNFTFTDEDIWVMGSKHPVFKSALPKVEVTKEYNTTIRSGTAVQNVDLASIRSTNISSLSVGVYGSNGSTSPIQVTGLSVNIDGDLVKLTTSSDTPAGTYYVAIKGGKF